MQEKTNRSHLDPVFEERRPFDHFRLQGIVNFRNQLEGQSLHARQLQHPFFREIADDENVPLGSLLEVCND